MASLNNKLKTAFEAGDTAQIQKLLVRGATPDQIIPDDSNWEAYQDLVAQYKKTTIRTIVLYIVFILFCYLLGLGYLCYTVGYVVNMTGQWGIAPYLLAAQGVLILIHFILIFVTYKAPVVSSALCLTLNGLLFAGNLLLGANVAGLIPLLFSIQSLRVACRLSSFVPQKRNGFFD